MANESIAVYFKPLSTFSGLTYYHETLLYTDSNGVQYLVTAYDSIDAAGTIRNVSEAAAAAEYGFASNFGTIVTQVTPLSALSQDEQAHWLGTAANPYTNQVLATGTNLSQQWASISQAYQEIGSANLAYSPMTQNSNSVASTGLTAAGVQLPSGTTIFGPNWTQASIVILPTSLTSPSDNQPTNFATDSQGNITMSIADQNNGNQGSGAFSFNSSGSPTGASLEPPSNSDFNLSGDATNVTVIGSDETINLTPNSGSLLAVDGVGDVVSGNSGSNQAGLSGWGRARR